MEKTSETVGGWAAPCVHFDYGAMAAEEARACAQVARHIRKLRRETPETWEETIVLRRRIAVFTGIYYEMRERHRVLAARAAARSSPPPGKCS